MGRRTDSSNTSSTDSQESDDQPDESQTTLDETESFGAAGGTAAGVATAGDAAGTGAAGAAAGAGAAVVDPIVRKILPDDLPDTPDQETPGEEESSERDPPSEHPEETSSSGGSAEPVERSHPDSSEPAESEDQPEDETEAKERTGKMVIHTDPWSALTWCLDPLFKRIELLAGGSVDLHFVPAPPRTFESPSAMKERWAAISEGRSMPLNLDVWDQDPPQSTELSTRAFCAAFAQGESYAADYLKRLQIAALVEGTNIEDKEVLMELATEVGLDAELSDSVLERTELPDLPTNGNLPVIQYWVDEQLREPSTGKIELHDVAWRLSGSSLSIESVSWQSIPLSGFVSNYGPVPTKEVATIYETNITRIRPKLERSHGVKPIRYGKYTFWEN
jgi:hypothetical protein